MLHAGFGKAAALALFVAVANPSPSVASERVALVIGNSAYRHTVPLRNPKNDAGDMARSLRELGFAVIEGLDLDEAAFEAKLREFARAAVGAEATLFYYAGHGLQVDEENYLVPVDAQLVSEVDVRLDTISLDTVMTEMRSKVNLVFLDACRDNPLAQNLARSMGPNRSSAVGRGLGRVEDSAGMLIAYATAPGNVASDGDGENSPFTEALLANLAVPGVSVNDLMTAVTDAVAVQTGGQQQPWTHSSLRTPFYFNAGDEHRAADATLAETGTSQVTFVAEETAARAYEAAERVHTTAAYKAVASRFPESIYADLALEQVRKIEESEAVLPGVAPNATTVTIAAVPDEPIRDRPSASLPTVSTETATDVDFGNDSSEWAHDGECDDPRFAGDGMAETLLAGDTGRDAADCRSLFEQGRIWLESRVGGSEDSLYFGDNGSEWAHDGECDDPRFAGDGMAGTLLAGDTGRDAADCRSLFEQGRIWLESRVGGSEDSLHFGDNGSKWAHDGECDDPRFAGDGMAETLLAGDTGRDAADCRSLFEQGRIRLKPGGT